MSRSKAKQKEQPKPKEQAQPIAISPRAREQLSRLREQRDRLQERIEVFIAALAAEKEIDHATHAFSLDRMRFEPKARPEPKKEKSDA